MPAHIQLSPWYVLDKIPRTSEKRLTPKMEGMLSNSLSQSTNDIAQ